MECHIICTTEYISTSSKNKSNFGHRIFQFLIDSYKIYGAENLSKLK